MASPEIPCLRLALDRLNAAETGHYATWVMDAPYPGGYVHNDRLWTAQLAQLWQTWQSFFSLRGLPMVPRVPEAYEPEAPVDPFDDTLTAAGQPTGYTSRLMQHFGISLWQWIFDGPVQNSLNQSQGIAMGQGRPLRVRLEIRDPELTALPWEIMQPQPGKQAISLSQQLLFSRTTSDVDHLPTLKQSDQLRILLVLGHDENPDSASFGAIEEKPNGSDYPQNPAEPRLALEQEAKMLAQLLEQSAKVGTGRNYASLVHCEVDTLLQPSPAELIQKLESQPYNVFFYSGHGMPAPDGGLLFVQPNGTLNGTELAQVLTRCRVRLAVFNACWGAQPDQQDQQAISRSSLAEVLIHQGVPAVLGMRDSIADREALSFIQVFAQALAERSPIDEAVAIARQHLLTLYKFNQPAWTLPVLYMHPEFNGELIKPRTDGVTEIPESPSHWFHRQNSTAYLRLVTQPTRKWPIHGGIMRVGSLDGNDVILREPGVSRKHAEIFYREAQPDSKDPPTYFLRDYSRFGTLMLKQDGWRKIHHQEVQLTPKTQLKFGSSNSPALEFLVDQS